MVVTLDEEPLKEETVRTGGAGAGKMLARVHYNVPSSNLKNRGRTMLRALGMGKETHRFSSCPLVNCISQDTRDY